MLVFADFPSPNPEDYNETIDIEKETKKEEETETKVSEELRKKDRRGKALDACCLPACHANKDCLSSSQQSRTINRMAFRKDECVMP